MDNNCRTIICPKCGHAFDACFLDYGDQELDWFPKCPKCGAVFVIRK